MSNFMLKSKRISLRPLIQSDWKLISFLRTDDEVNRFVKRSSASDQKEATQFINKINEGIQNENLLYWVITIKSTNEAIGTICLWNYSKDMTTAELGYDLKPQFQQNGFMSESIKLIISHAFEVLKFRNLLAYTHYKNLKSINLLKKNNFILMDGKKDDSNSNNVIYSLEFDNYIIK